MKAIVISREDRKVPVSEGNPDEIVGVSCVNLRNDDGTWRAVDEKIMVKCTVCGKRKQLGKDTAAVVRIESRATAEVFCDKCMDVFTEVGVFGSRVITDAHRWELTSQVTRVAAIHEHMKCFRCSKKSEGHLFVKYYDVTRMSERTGRQKPMHFLKVCGVCMSEILTWVVSSKIMVEGHEFPLRKQSLPAVPIRRWMQ